MTAIEQAKAGSQSDAVLRARRLITPVDGTRRALNVRFGVEDGDDVKLGHHHRPSWRGGVRTIGLVLAAPTVIALVLSSHDGTRVRLAVAVYAVGLCSTFAVSATYHRWVHGLKARCSWRRADHATIFATIAGSSTPIVLVALPGAAGLVLIGAVWSVALVGAGCKLARWGGGDLVGMVLYGVVGALGAAAVPWLWVRVGIIPAALVVAGGVVYLVGALCFARRWPTLRPSVFSYHEVWHVFTVVGAAVQFTAIWMVAT